MTRLHKALLIVVAGSSMLPSAAGQFLQQGSKLVGSSKLAGNSGLGNPQDHGYSVALSSDGNTAIVGGVGAAGAAWVYTREAGVWSQPGSKLAGMDGAGNPNQAYSVAISSDGDTAIVGGFGDNGNIGAAWVFTRTAGVWSQQGSKLVGTGAAGNSQQGMAVALTRDGNTAIVGGPGDNGGMGAAWLFTRTAGMWSQQGDKLVGAGGAGNPQQGYSVAFSADGNTAMVGGPNDNGINGAAWVYARTAGVWSQQGDKLVGAGGVGNQQQGVSVALSGDGNTAIVGGLNDNGFNGAAWVYTRTAGVWNQQGSKLVGAGAAGAAGQGWSVALSSDGNLAIVGGPIDDGGIGAAWVYTRSDGVWSQQGSKLIGAGGVGNARQGWSVALSEDASTMIVGGLLDNGSAGAAWVYAASAGLGHYPGAQNPESNFLPGGEHSNAIDAPASPRIHANAIQSAGQAAAGSTGTPNLVWQNDTTRQVTVHYYGGAGGAVYQGFNFLNIGGVPGWHIAGSADFDGNGVPDLVWQNDTTRQVTVHYYGGAGGAVYQGFNFLNIGGVPGWSVVAVADFDGNGVPDLVWQNDTTRQVTVHYYGGAQGAVYQGFNFLNIGGVPGWKVAGAADFDGNGVPDLIWQNDTTRQVTVHYYGGAQGAVYQGFNFLNIGGVPGWKVAGAADLDNNGVPDLVWLNDTTRQVTVHYYGGLQGAVYQSFNFLNIGGVPGWKVVAVTKTAAAATPGSITPTSGTGQSAQVGTAFGAPLAATVKDTTGNPLGGVTVTFTAPVAGASGSFTGAATAVTNASGVATSSAFTANATAGSYAVTASVSGVATPASFSLTNTPVATQGAITVTSISVGRNLQAALTITISQPAPAGGLNVTLTSGDPTKVLLGQSVAEGFCGAGCLSIPVIIGEGQTTVTGFYAKALVGTGTVQLTAAANGFATGTATVTLTPSGFVLSGPNGVGSPSFTVSQGVNATNLTVSAYRLDSALNVVEPQFMASSVTVQISDSTPVTGTVAPTSITLLEGDLSSTITFNALATGTTTLAAVAPTGFSTPAGGAAAQFVTVTPAGLSAPAVTVGKDLENITNVTLHGASPSGGLVVTIASNDATKVLFSATPTDPGLPVISVKIPAGFSNTPDFYVYGLASSGLVSYTASAPGFGAVTGTVTLTPSGFVISGPFGLGADFFTTTGAGNSDLSIIAAQLDPLLNPSTQQAIRGGISVNVTVTSSNPATGTITASPVTIAGGTAGAHTQFQPVTAGPTGTILAVSAAAAGFSIPAIDASITATVIVPKIIVTDQVSIGQGLQSTGTVLISQAAPSTGLQVTLTDNTGQLRFASSPTAVGVSQLTLTIPAGQTFALYYIQALGNTGSVTYTGSAPGYLTGSGTITMSPSGVIIKGPAGVGFPLNAPLAAGKQPVSVTMVRLDSTNTPINPIEIQQLAGGSNLIVSLTIDSAAIGTVTSPVTITGGSATAISQFTPVAIGTTIIRVTKPANFALPTNFTTLTVTVQ